MNKIKSISFLLILFTAFSLAQEELKISDAVKITLENNLDIKIIENRTKISKNNASIMNSGYLPTVRSNAGINKSEQDIEIETPNNISGKLDEMKSENSFSNVTVNYTLFDNTGRNFNYKKSKELLNKSKLEVKEVIENTLLQLFTVYYEVCRLIEEKEIIRSSLEISKSRLERKKTKFEFGQSTKLELLNAEVDVNTDSIRFLNSIKNLSNAKRDLNLVMNVDLNSNYDLDNDSDMSDGSRFNLIANPFLSFLYANDNTDSTNNLITANTSVLHANGQALYFWDGDEYISVNHATTTSYQYVAPFQGFMVMAKTTGSNTSFSFTRAMQTVSGTNDAIGDIMDDDTGELFIGISQQGIDRQTEIYFSENAHKKCLPHMLIIIVVFLFRKLYSFEGIALIYDKNNSAVPKFPTICRSQNV